MGHQVTFYLLPSDYPAVEAAVRLSGDVILLRDRVPEPPLARLQTIALTDEEMRDRHNRRIYVSREEYADEITCRYVPEQEHLVIEPGSPVIEFDRCVFNGQLLMTGRLYFYTGDDVDPGFTKWADRVLRSVRKVLTRSPSFAGAYFGPAAMEWTEAVRAKSAGLGLVATTVGV